MNFFTIVCLALMLCSIKSEEYFIFTYKNFVDRFQPQKEGKWKDPFSLMTEQKRQSLCRNLNSAVLVTGKNNVDNYFHKNVADIPNEDFTDLLFFNEDTRQDLNNKVNFNTDLRVDSDLIQATTLSCAFQVSVIHLAMNLNFRKYYFLFGNKTNGSPVLLAYFVPYFENIEFVETSNTFTIYNYILQRNSLISARDKNLYSDEIHLFRSRTGVENFQLCTSLMQKYIYLRYLKIHFKKYSLKIFSTENDQRTTITMSPIRSITPIKVYVLKCKFYSFGLKFKFNIMPTEEFIKLYIMGPDEIWRTFIVRDLVDSDINL